MVAWEGKQLWEPLTASAGVEANYGGFSFAHPCKPAMKPGRHKQGMCADTHALYCDTACAAVPDRVFRRKAFTTTTLAVLTNVMMVLCIYHADQPGRDRCRLNCHNSQNTVLRLRLR